MFSQISTQPKTANKLGIKTQVVVDLSDRRTYVYQGDIVIASYPIAIGKKGWETPTGAFEVMNMQHDPIWQHPITGKVFPPGNDSPLGERWMVFGQMDAMKLVSTAHQIYICWDLPFLTVACGCVILMFVCYTTKLRLVHW